jgi:hypothetical protein
MESKQIDIFQEIEKRNNMIDNKNNSIFNSEQNKIDTTFNPENDDCDTLLSINKNLRDNIKLSLSIYKQLNNFDHKYINELFNKKTKGSS